MKIKNIKTRRSFLKLTVLMGGSIFIPKHTYAIWPFLAPAISFIGGVAIRWGVKKLVRKVVGTIAGNNARKVFSSSVLASAVMSQAEDKIVDYAERKGKNYIEDSKESSFDYEIKDLTKDEEKRIIHKLGYKNKNISIWLKDSSSNSFEYKARNKSNKIENTLVSFAILNEKDEIEEIMDYNIEVDPVSTMIFKVEIEKEILKNLGIKKLAQYDYKGKLISKSDDILIENIDVIQRAYNEIV